MSADDHERFHALFEGPSAVEFDATRLPPPPDGSTFWLSWAASRWPTLPELTAEDCNRVHAHPRSRRPSWAAASRDSVTARSGRREGAGTMPGWEAGWDAWLVESLDLDGRRFEIARASESDLPALVALLADDDLGAHRESTDFERYRMAFQEIDSDPRQLLVAVRDGDDVLVGTMQLTLIAGLARGGAKRLQIESVRVASSIRNAGLGTALFEWAHQYGRRHGATLAQLTSDKTRANAHRFYDALGYQASHEGLKRPL